MRSLFPLPSSLKVLSRISSRLMPPNVGAIALTATAAMAVAVGIGLYSTVLYQAYINHVPVVIDDLTAPERFAQLKSLCYIMLDKPHGLLSALLQEESPT